MRNLFVLLICSLVLCACETQPRTRPFGELRLGQLADFLGPETYLKDQRLLVRRDDAGFSIMSTLCTYDLSPLFRKSMPDGHNFFASAYSESQYSDDGIVLHGPSRFNLPYYYLFLAPGRVGSPVDTFYVKIGVEVPKTWRLKVNIKSSEQAK